MDRFCKRLKAKGYMTTTTTTTSRTGTALPSVYLVHDKDSYLGWMRIIIKDEPLRGRAPVGEPNEKPTSTRYRNTTESKPTLVASPGCTS
jgi:hypothetical protein